MKNVKDTQMTEPDCVILKKTYDINHPFKNPDKLPCTTSTY